MKAAVIYKSKTGFAKQYAGWLAEELKADLDTYELESFNIIAKL
jgi:flavodoxin